jgi:hypothetical protein
MESNTETTAVSNTWVRKGIPIWATIGESFGFATKNFRLLFLLSIAGFAIQAVTVFIPSQTIPALNILTVPLTLAGIFMSLWSTVAIITALAKIYYKQYAGFKESFGASVGKIWPFVINSILRTFMIFFGTLLLVIPGIYFAVKYSFVSIAVVVEDHRSISPFKMSAALVKKYFWMVVGYGLAIALTLLPLAIVFGTPVVYFVGKYPDAVKTFKANPLMPVSFLVIYILDAAILPYIHSMNFVLYAKLREAKQGSEELSNQEKLMPKMNGCVMAILFVVLTIVLALAFYFIFRGIIPHKLG